MEFLNYPPIQLSAIGIMTATLICAAIRLWVTTGPRGALRDFLALVIIVGASTLGFGIGAHIWMLIVGSWSAVVLAWATIESINYGHRRKQEGS